MTQANIGNPQGCNLSCDNKCDCGRGRNPRIICFNDQLGFFFFSSCRSGTIYQRYDCESTSWWEDGCSKEHSRTWPETYMMFWSCWSSSGGDQSNVSEHMAEDINLWRRKHRLVADSYPCAKNKDLALQFLCYSADPENLQRRRQHNEIPDFFFFS